MINIRGTTAVDDPEYRYKMPAIQGKVKHNILLKLKPPNHPRFRRAGLNLPFAPTRLRLRAAATGSRPLFRT